MTQSFLENGGDHRPRGRTTEKTLDAEAADPAPFFQAIQLGCVLFLALLLALAAGSAYLLAQRLLQPVQEASGVPGAVEQTARDGGVSYGVALETETGEVLFLRLRNHGRILPYLQQTAGDGGRVTVTYRDGELLSLRATGGAGGEGVQLAESQAPVAAYAVVFLLSLALLLLLGQSVVAWPGRLGADTTSSAEQEEE